MAQPRPWYNEDTVKSSGSEERCIIVRAWNDANEDESYVQEHPDAPPPLKSGEVELFSPLSNDTRPKVVGEASLELLDRQFLPGDLARAPTTGDVGVVLKVDVEVRLKTTLGDVEVPGWVKADTVSSEHRITRGDIVTANNWIGQVEEVFQEAVVEDPNGREPFRICDLDRGVLSVGATAQSIKEHASAFFSVDMPGGFPEMPFGRVIDLRQGAVAVNWLAINQMLPPAEQNLSRPKRIWTDIDGLTMVTSHTRPMCAIGDKVYPTSPASSTTARLVTALGRRMEVEDRFMTVIDRRSCITVKWMDNTVTENASSRSFEVGEFADEEHDTFPGEVVVWEAEGERKVAIVQEVDTKRRVTKVRWWGTDETALVSSLELDPNGKPPASYGTRRGDIVLLSPGPVFATFPDVPRIGQSDEQISSEQVRNEVQTIGFNAARSTNVSYIRTPKVGQDASDVRWVGAIHDLLTDGTVQIELPDGTIVIVPHDHLYLFMDHDAGGDGAGTIADEDEMMSEGGSQDSWMTEEGDVVYDGENEDEVVMKPPDKDWAAESTDGEQEDGMDLDGGSGQATPQPDARPAGSPVQPVAVADSTLSQSLRVPGASLAEVNGIESAPLPPAHNETIAKETPWKPFLTMEEAPQSHHFYAEAQTKPPRNFLSRLKKEYAALESSLPENIIVRAYEDRTDLLRACIIGSADTPYEDACFLFDLHLPPAKFPQEPPGVFFHSWTNGGGRIQPNLYEQDGKVCLSVLGTWAGDSTESWSASRSSLLQVLVSISGLCLVKDPYFCEPGYEKQRGTLSGRIAANLYSERAYVLTRGFIKHALEYGVTGGFDDELRWLYLSGPPDGKGRLLGVVAKAKRLIEESERANEGPDVDADQVAASGTLTLGGAIPLKRTVAALEKRLTASVSHA